MVSDLFNNIVFLDLTKSLFLTFFINYFLTGRIVTIKELSVISAVTIVYWYIILTLRKKYQVIVND